MCLTNWETSEPTGVFFFFYFNKDQRLKTPRQVVGKGFYFSGKGLTKGKAGKQTMLLILW